MVELNYSIAKLTHAEITYTAYYLILKKRMGVFPFFYVILC